MFKVLICVLVLALDWVRFEPFSVRLWLGLGKFAKSEFFQFGFEGEFGFEFSVIMFI